MSKSPNEHDDRVVQLIANAQYGLFLYICGLLFSRELAEDVLQETNLVLWQKRDEYRPGSNFYAWACRIAYYKACKARDEHHRKVPAFSDLFLQQFAPPLQAITEAHSQEQDYLDECLNILSDRDRDMLARRYEDGDPTKVIADDLGQSVRTVNRSLARIHEVLFECIRGKAAKERRS